MEVKIKKLVPEAVIPTYAKSGDMGMDIVATSVEYAQDIDCYIYHTGLAFEVPVGYGLLMFPRSSNRKKNVYLANSVGILDSGYRGEMMFCFKDRTAVSLDICVGIFGAKFANTDIVQAVKQATDNKESLKDAPYQVGDKIGQIVIIPYPTITFTEVDELSSSDRGEGGFGSTGK